MRAGVISSWLCVPEPWGALKTGQKRQGWDQNPAFPVLRLSRCSELPAAPGMRSSVR